MRARDFITDQDFINLIENVSAGGTGTGSIASVPNGVGGVIKRMPTTPNLFGYVQPVKRKPKKKRKTSH